MWALSSGLWHAPEVWHSCSHPRETDQRLLTWERGTSGLWKPVWSLDSGPGEGCLGGSRAGHLVVLPRKPRQWTDSKGCPRTAMFPRPPWPRWSGHWWERTPDILGEAFHTGHECRDGNLTWEREPQQGGTVLLPAPRKNGLLLGSKPLPGILSGAQASVPTPHLPPLSLTS